jgi:hypothetical protein
MTAKSENATGLKTVYVAHGMLRAMVIRGALESAGIPVILNYESLGQTLGVTVDGIGQVQVMVPVEWEKEAQALLNAHPPRGEVFYVPADKTEEESQQDAVASAAKDTTPSEAPSDSETEENI